MKQYVRCKSCGFIMVAGKLKDKCPACGVPAKMFEEYVPEISEKRARILDLDLHPVIVHAPQAFAFFVLIFACVYAFSAGGLRDSLLCSVKVLSLMLPIVVIGAMASGILDGVTRFRKVTTPILKKKIALGSVFFVFSSGMVILTQFFDMSAILFLLLFLGCNLVSFAASAILGLLGSSIRNSKFRG